MLRRVGWTVPLALAGVLVLVLLAAGGWDARYVLRVVLHGDSDIADVGWKAHTTVAPSTPRPWPTGRCPVPDLPTDRAQSVLVVRKGELACEWYGNGGAPDRPAAGFSLSKTVLALLLSRELPDLDAPVTAGVPELARRDPRFGAITLAELVDMRSGIAFTEDVPFPWVNQDQPAVYYATDLERTVVERPVISSGPGPFTYNDYAPNLSGLAFRRMTGRLLTDEPLRQLWADLGAQDPVYWCVDDRGFPYHESGIVVTARDLARVGELVLAGDGPFAARSLEPSGVATTLGDTPVGYHNGWWRLPGGDLAAMGDHGQIMVVSPAAGTVVVRMGDDAGPNIELAVTLASLAHRVGQSG